MRAIPTALILGALAACTAGPPTPAEQAARAERTERLDAREQDLLAGLEPGDPVPCINSALARSTSFIGERSILYRVSPGLIYRNDPPGGCTGLRETGVAIITSTPSTQLCRGEIVRVVDTVAGNQWGGCSLGDFVPYRRPSNRDDPS